MSPVILITRNGGASWSAVARESIGGRRLSLASITCPNRTTCYAGSDSGSVLITNDGGTSWRWSDTGSHFRLSSIACTDAHTCFAAGGLDADCNDDECWEPEQGVVLLTRDGGATWQQVFYRAVDFGKHPTMGARLFAIACPTATTCLATGHAILIETTNGGRSWQTHPGLALGPLPHAPKGSLPTTPIGLNPPTALVCPSAASCFAESASGIGVTQDGGKTWHDISEPPALGPIGHTYGGLTCPSPAVCYAAGWPGVILKWTG
jgi:hypothetical protein